MKLKSVKLFDRSINNLKYISEDYSQIKSKIFLNVNHVLWAKFLFRIDLKGYFNET